MIIERMKEILAQHGNPNIRAKTWSLYTAYVSAFTAQQQRAEEIGYYQRPHATTFCSSVSCDREAAFKGLGFEADNPPNWRGQNVFAMGNFSEAWVLALLEQSGITFTCGHSYSLPRWEISYPEKEWQFNVTVTPDAVWHPTKEQRLLPDGEMISPVIPIEIKSSSGKGYDRIESDGIRRAKPGYYDQAMLEMAAFRASHTLFLVINRDTGALYEELVAWDESRYTELYDLFNDIYEQDDPFAIRVPHAPRAEYRKFQGASAGRSEAEALAKTLNTTAEEIVQANGRVWGYQVKVGESLPWQCGYCGFRGTCYAQDGYALREEYRDDKIIVWAERD